MATEYVKHFGMAETPFARKSRPTMALLSTQHKRPLSRPAGRFQEHGGLALIRGDVGQGKSFLVEYLMTVGPIIRMEMRQVTEYRSLLYFTSSTSV